MGRPLRWVWVFGSWSRTGKGWKPGFKGSSWWLGPHGLAYRLGLWGPVRNFRSLGVSCEAEAAGAVGGCHGVELSWKPGSVEDDLESRYIGTSLELEWLQLGAMGVGLVLGWVQSIGL